jgi:hypothetical protein
MDDDDVNLLANFAFISAIDNKVIGGDAPSSYKARMAQNRLREIAAGAFLPEVTWTDDFFAFLRERSELLATAAKKLIA